MKSFINLILIIHKLYTTSTNLEITRLHSLQRYLMSQAMLLGLTHN